MAEGHYRGMDPTHPEIRRLFTRDALLASDWYRERLVIKQGRDAALYRRHVDYLQGFLAEADTRCEPDGIARCEAALAEARSRLAEIESPAYLDSLWGSLGADWVHRA
jgi:phage terminase Nu1 subunit (DNA packaging protein)